MKTLQNDYTTPEQSKRLLELGVPADSANYAYMCYEIGDMCRVFINHPYTIYSENVKRLLGRRTLPCWSVGRLIEITKICITDKDALTEIFELLRDCTFITRNLCQVFEEYSDVLDFSKLED